MYYFLVSIRIKIVVFNVLLFPTVLWSRIIPDYGSTDSITRGTRRTVVSDNAAATFKPTHSTTVLAQASKHWDKAPHTNKLNRWKCLLFLNVCGYVHNFVCIPGPPIVFPIRSVQSLFTVCKYKALHLNVYRLIAELLESLSELCLSSELLFSLPADDFVSCFFSWRWKPFA